MDGAYCLLLALNWTVRSLSCWATGVELSWRSLLRMQAMVSDDSELGVDSPVLDERQAVVSMP